MTDQLAADEMQAAGTRRPTAASVLVALCALLVYRVLGFVELADVGELPDGAPESWFVPLLGDGVIGTAMLITAILLWKRATPGVWLTAVIVHFLAMWDTAAAAINNARNPWDASDFADVMWFLFGFVFLVSVVSLYLLSRVDVRRHYGVYGVNNGL